MDIEAFIRLTNGLIFSETGKPLNDLQTAVLRGALQRQTYSQIAESFPCNDSHAKEVGSLLWKQLSVVLRVKVGKDNIKSVLEQRLNTEEKVFNSSPISNVSLFQNETPVFASLNFQKNPDNFSCFVGREDAINDLNTLVDQGRKIIVIQAAGGVGKTTLAKRYLAKFEMILSLEMAKEKENITPIESVVEEWLKQYFQEEPGREFGITMARLKIQLQNHKVGILIDNLEPILDKQGRLIEKHTNYVKLLDIVADSTVQSTTIITSRERLCDDRVNGIYHYPLAVLTVEAWKEFFASRTIKIDISSLEAMHRIYGGNAKAMDILFGVMREDYDGDMAAYWQENCTLVETELKNLVESQFNRLQTLDPEAYKLLCRLGCFRYQDVPRVSIDALLALLWDIPENKQRTVIKSLRNRCLVEYQKGEYWLHPAIRAEAIFRLRQSDEWEYTNYKAAQFWVDSVQTIETVEDAKKAFEAYYHYLEIRDYEQSANVIIQQRNNKWINQSPLGISCYRLGLLKQLIIAINFIKDKINPSYKLARLHTILAAIYWMTGCIHEAISLCKKTMIMVIQYQEKISVNNIIDFQKLKNLEATCLFGIGICKMDLGELEDAIIIFLKITVLNSEKYDVYSIDDVFSQVIISWFCLAYLYSHLGYREQAYLFAKKSEKAIPVTEWGLGHKLFFLGKTYKNLGEIEKAFVMYNQVILFTEESYYTQAKAKALTGLAELYREQDDFSKALSHHSESIQLLYKIGAKCDLAEAYFQLALTYQKMGDLEKIHVNIDEAIRLFTEMEAPKQVQKVREAIINQ